MTDIKEKAEYLISSFLDYPSVYMGGPSKMHRDKAIMIINMLEKAGIVLVNK